VGVGGTFWVVTEDISLWLGWPKSDELHDWFWGPNLYDWNEDKLEKFEDCCYFPDTIAHRINGHDAGDADVVHLEDPGAEQAEHADGVPLQKLG